MSVRLQSDFRIDPGEIESNIIINLIAD